MSGHLLDTSLLIARDERGALELPASAAISVVSLGELRAGVLLAGGSARANARARRLAAVRSAFAALPVDEAVAERYGELLALARSRRRQEKATDLLISATAAATGRRLWTRDAAQSRLAHAAGLEATLV